MRATIADKPVDVGGQTIPVTVSVGAAAGAGNIDRLVREADAALYEAKAAGRNRVVIAATDGA